ncbi:MAG: response regulator [Fibrobacterales bacterium]
MKNSILVIDDDQSSLDLVVEALSDENYTIHVTTKPEEGLELFEKHTPLCILLDLNMPKMSGFEFIDHIKLNFDSTFSVVVMTGDTSMETSKTCYQRGVFDIIRKPLNIYDLMSVVRNAVMLQQRKKRISFQEHIDRLSKERTNELVKEHKNLSDSREVIEKAYKIKSELLSDISHEVRNPLNVIINFSSMLLEMYRQKDFEDFESILEAVNVSSTNLAKILDNIITLSEIEHGSLNEEIESFDVAGIMSSMVSLFKVKASEKGLEFSYHKNEALNENIVTDKIKFKQVIFAIMEFGYSEIHSKGAIGLGMDLQRDKLEITATFKGVNLSPETINTLFDTKIDMTSYDNSGLKGLGIGLPLAKRYAQLMKGDVIVKNATPQECTLLFSIPYVVAVDPTKKADWTDIQFSSENKILLCEDQPINVMIIKKMLKKMGLEIEVAMNGQIGVEKAKKLKPDLILMDIQMPVMDGLEATRIIRKTKEIKDTPVVGVSAYSAKEKEMKNMDFTDFIVKPINKTRFVQVLSKFLKRVDEQS